MTTPQLPVIDISQIQNQTKLNAIADEIGAAIEHSGFLYVAGHGIDTSLIDAIRQQQISFFNLALEAKARVAINENNRGYLGEGMARMHGARQHDQKEVFFWGAELADDHPDRVQRVPLCGANQWPAEPPGFRDAVLSYADAIQNVGNQLLRAFARVLDVPDAFFSDYFHSPMTRGQLIHYPPTVGDADSFGVAPHTDFGCLTLLLQETAGLEVLSRQGEWISAPPTPGTLVVNIGDLLERWSDGRLPSTTHRVRNLTGDERYSIAMFHDPDPTARIDPADMGRSQGQFPPVTAADYIMGRNQGAFTHFGQVQPAQATS